MGNPFREYAKHLRTITERVVEKDLLTVIKEHEITALDLNTAQLMRGEDSQGHFVNPPYQSIDYAEMKLHLNPAGVVDLKLTGRFHNSFYLRAGSFPISIWARDKKTNMLVAKYGAKIFNLQQGSIRFFQEDIKPDFTQRMRGRILRV